MLYKFDSVQKVEGELFFPGDKSISHRSVMFASLAKGKSRIKNLSSADDVVSTIKCFQQLGINIYSHFDLLEVEGRGFRGLIKSSDVLDAGNSGTTARLLAGILAGQNFTSSIKGDQSLSKRPMKRVIEPLSLMGTKINASPEVTLPLKIFPPAKLKPIQYSLPIASAQVKSTVLLAGLHCDKPTEVIETIQTRNHTEVMLGLRVNKREGNIYSTVSRENYPEAQEYIIPSDISTAAFFIVLTLLIKYGQLVIKNISLNETRTGVIKILKRMGGAIEILEERFSGSERSGDILVKSSELKNVHIEKEMIPNIIDEIPILAVAGLFADGQFEIRNSSELRAKESDRIKSLCSNFKLLGLSVQEFEDGFKVEGEIQNKPTVFESYGDHRIAMAFAILSLLLKDGAAVNEFECVKISNPDFIKQISFIAS